MTTSQIAPLPGLPITLEVHICDQRRSYTARFATEQQAVAFVEQRSSTHAFHEIETAPFDYQQFPALYDLLYPTCEHGLDANNCYGPQHWYMDDEEQRYLGVW